MIKNFYKNKEEIENLPAPIREFLDNPEKLNKLNNICGSFELNAEQEDGLRNIILRLARGEVDLYNMASIIADELEIDFSAAMDINDKLYEELFINAEADLNANYAARQESVSAEIPKVTDRDIIKSEERKAELAPSIAKAVKKFNLFSGDETGQKKFSEIADTFLSGVRTKTQFKNTLTKDVASGGLGMEHKLADDVAEFLASYSRLQPVIAKSEAAKQSRVSVIARSPRRGNLVSDGGVATPSEGLAMTQEAKPVPPNTRIEVDFSREEKEAARQKPKIEKIRAAAPKLLSVTEGVRKALEELNYTFPSSELQERLKSVIDARVRNVRTSLQTFDKLTQRIPDGGLGFSKLEADKVSLILNKYLDAKNQDIYGSKLAEIKQAEDEEKKKNEERTRAAEEAERNKLDERFTKLTGKTPPPPSVIPATSPAELQRSGKAGIQSSPALTKSEIAEKKQAKSPPTPLLQRGEEEAPPPLKKEGGGGFVPAPSPVQSSKFKVQSSSLPPRPVLEDIKYTPKLAGPVEEIVRLTLEDFRKLSGDPKEAVLKIKDKLVLLREESYKKYQAGVDAWYRSPLYGEYLKAMSQSLTAGAPLGDVLKGGQTLTQDEFDAIISNKVGD